MTCTGDKKNKPRTTIIYTTEREDKIIDSESCANVREWRACVNMGDRLLSKFVWLCACCVRVWTVWDLQQTTFAYTRQDLSCVSKSCLLQISHCSNTHTARIHTNLLSWSYTCTSSALSLAQFFLTILAQFLPILFWHQSHSCTPYKWRTHTTHSSNLLFLSWLPTDDGVDTETSWSPNNYLYHRIWLTINKIVYYQHLLVSFEELLSLRLSDHFALVVSCINNLID